MKSNRNIKYAIVSASITFIFCAMAHVVAGALNTRPPKYDVQKVISAVDDKYIGEAIYSESIKYGLDPYQMASVAFKESSLRQKAYCPRKNGEYDRGLFQIYNGTAVWLYDDVLKEYGNAKRVKKNPRELYDIHLNVHTACAFMRWIIDHPKSSGAKSDVFSAYHYYATGKKSGRVDMTRAYEFYHLHFGGE